MQTTTETNATPKSSGPASADFSGFMRQRHRPLCRLYKQDPKAAWVADSARTSDAASLSDDPIHGELIIGDTTLEPHRAPLAIHSAVGGDHDGPNPGDYLAAALAACFDRTARIIANRLGINIESLTVAVKAEVDVRGTLCIDPDVPVQFQRLTLTSRMQLDDAVPEAMRSALVTAAEHSCVVMQTLRGGVEVVTKHETA